VQLFVIALEQIRLFPELLRLLEQSQERLLPLIRLPQLNFDALVGLLDGAVLVVELVVLADEFLVVLEGDICVHLLYLV